MQTVIDTHTTQSATPRRRRSAGAVATFAAGVNVIAAGVPGALLLAAPAWAAENVLGASAVDPVAATMLGALWTGIGVRSGYSLATGRGGRDLADLYAFQVLYKTMWMVAVLVNGTPFSASAVGFFAGYAVAVPFLAAAARSARRART